MTDAGYGGTPLHRKLGVKPGSRLLVSAAPPGFALDTIPRDAVVHTRAGSSAYDVVLAFCPDWRRLRTRLPALAPKVTTAGALWIAWPKKSGPLAGNLDENVVRDAALGLGLVDVKVAAIDDTWSALKLVRRVRDR